MKVRNYEDWQKAVSKEYTKLAEISVYLNENGKERLMAFDTLSTAMCFHDSAADLLAWTKKPEGASEADREALNSKHISVALKCLERIASTTFWKVTTKFYDRGTVKVRIEKVTAEKKPENTMAENKMCDEYHDFFDTYEEARKFAQDAEKA